MCRLSVAFVSTGPAVTPGLSAFPSKNFMITSVNKHKTVVFTYPCGLVRTTINIIATSTSCSASASNSTRSSLPPPPEAYPDDTDAHTRWADALDAVLTHTGVSADLAANVLARSYGWSLQKFWRGSRKCLVPDAQEAQQRIAFLKEKASMNKFDDLFEKFPEVLGCDVELMQASLEQMAKWNVTGDRLAMVLQQKPEYLGYNYNCYGSCEGECNRCWERFE